MKSCPSFGKTCDDLDTMFGPNGCAAACTDADKVRARDGKPAPAPARLPRLATVAARSARARLWLVSARHRVGWH